MEAIDIRNVLDYNESSGEFVWKVRPNGRVPSGASAGTRTKAGYVRIKIRGRFVMAHRLAWLLCHGEMPGGYIDHINGERDDNRIDNLRVLTNQGNAENRRVGGKRKNGGTLLGASWAPRNRKWRSTIYTNGVTMHIGMFDTEQQAHDAYIIAKRVLHKGNTL